MSGTNGRLRLDNAYSYNLPIKVQITKDGKTTKKRFAKHDQFAAELIYFSRCILQNLEVEPSGWEGLADIRIIEAILESANTGIAVPVNTMPKTNRPSLAQKIAVPSIVRPMQIHVLGPNQH